MNGIDAYALSAHATSMNTTTTPAMLRVLAIACRDGIAIAGKSAHAGRVEHVPAATIAALIARGLLSQAHGSDGNCAGRPTDAGRAALAGLQS
jgi:hypothetical protein